MRQQPDFAVAHDLFGDLLLPLYYAKTHTNQLIEAGVPITAGTVTIGGATCIGKRHVRICANRDQGNESVADECLDRQMRGFERTFGHGICYSVGVCDCDPPKWLARHKPR